jgi:hypothetical protein
MVHAAPWRLLVYMEGGRRRLRGGTTRGREERGGPCEGGGEGRIPAASRFMHAFWGVGRGGDYMGMSDPDVWAMTCMRLLGGEGCRSSGHSQTRCRKGN